VCVAGVELGGCRSSEEAPDLTWVVREGFQEEVRKPRLKRQEKGAPWEGHWKALISRS
jgi:hypothetical protein